jgi:Zn-dependent peptidase ImmA (M78 family)
MTFAQTQLQLAREALAAALELRKNKIGNLVDPICIYDLAEKVEVEVRFADIPSLEGMYSGVPRPAIIIGSERPAGRRVYTCGHELGHHVFGHGTRVDEIRQDDDTRPFQPEEYLAQLFSGFLLMPKLAVCSAFAIRGWKPMSATPEQIYRIAALFGVTHTALIHHMAWVLGLLPKIRAAQLLDVKLKDIRMGLVPDGDRHIVPVDTLWKGRAIDLEVGDIVLAPSKVTCEGQSLIHVEHMPKAELFEARQPGCARFSDSVSGWASYIRVSRHFYVGRSKYRHFEEVENE